MTELKLIKGIQARHIKILTENGISTAEGLSMSSLKDVKELEGIGENTAKKLIWNARDALGMAELRKVSEIQENFEYISTGSSNFNSILGGGLSTGLITEVFGAFKSGKTAFAHTVSVTTQLPKGKGGLSGSVIYLDTENTFSKVKIIRIAKRFGLNEKDVLDRILHARIYSSDHQMQMAMLSEKYIKENNVRLIIVDSLMALFRAEYIGIGMLPKRQAELNKLIHLMSRIAETHNVAILFTNQVAQQMKGSFSAIDAIGGNIVAHGCHIRVMFKTKGFQANSDLMRKAVIVDAPDLPPDNCDFYITAAGIADEEDYGASDAKILGDDTIGISGLGDIKGLGKSTIEKLEELGISTPEQLKEADPESLAESIPKVSPQMVKGWAAQIGT